MDVSIIIVNYNTSVLIKKLLETIEDKTEGISYEVIVVDNNPTEQFAVDLKDYLDRIIYLPLKENVGFGRANNEGLKIAKGRNIFFLNPDTLLVNNAIKILSDYLDENENVGVCGGNLYDLDLNPNHSCMPKLPGLFSEINLMLGNSLYKLLYGSYDFNNTDNPKKVGYITGADMMVKRNILDKIGGFNPIFFMYYEETELSFRIKKEGYDIISVPSAKIIHLESKSFTSSVKKQKLVLQSRKKYLKIIYPLYKRIITDFVYIVSCIVALVVFTIKGDKQRKEIWLYSLKSMF
jgi:GT2 family glycosyltransferase